jgi:chemotaxis response regulator CheB
MPKAAAEAGAAEAILPLEQIAPRLKEIVAHQSLAHA